MSVSLVKVRPSTTVYVVGYAYGPYLPDTDNLTVWSTVEAAREALADELDRAATDLQDAEDDEMSTSISATAEYVRRDSFDVAYGIAKQGGWATTEVDGYTYWLHRTTLGAVFGDDTDSDEYLDLIDEITSR